MSTGERKTEGESKDNDKDKGKKKMKVNIDIIRHLNGRKYETVEISDCNYKTFNGAAKLMNKYIVSGMVEASTACPAGEDPKDFECHSKDGSYAIRHGNEVSVRVNDKIGICFSLNFDTDCDGNICYMYAMHEIRKIDM